MNPSAELPAENSGTGDADQNRRVPSDRRKTPTSAWAAFPPAGRRVEQRRASEHEQVYYVDRFSSSTFIFILMLVGGSLVDAILTLQLIDAGAQEINPLMHQLLQHGIPVFVIGKYVLTVAGLPLLLIFKNHYLFRTPLRVAHLIPIAVLLYVFLIVYQVTLIEKYVGWHEFS